eukprot:scaffold621252_cov55-Prasinocladus_malaysianus.AAC.1
MSCLTSDACVLGREPLFAAVRNRGRVALGRESSHPTHDGQQPVTHGQVHHAARGTRRAHHALHGRDGPAGRRKGCHLPGQGHGQHPREPHDGH